MYRNLALFISALAALLMLTSTARANLNQPALTTMQLSRCLAAKLRYEGKAAAASLACHAKAASQGLSVDANCIAGVRARMLAAFEREDPCLTTDDGPDRADDVADFLTTIDVIVGHAGSCDAVRSKAIGKYVAAAMKCYAKFVPYSGLVDHTCKVKAESKFLDEYATTQAMSGCTDPDSNPSSTTRTPANLFIDGQTCLLSPGNPGCPDFDDNGDGTVTDNDTGLQWEKKRNLDNNVTPGDPNDADNRYSWSASGTSADGTAYTTFLAALNTPPCFASQCDWRLPTYEELKTLLTEPDSPCTTAMCIDPIFGPTSTSSYWSSTTVPGEPTAGFDVYVLSFGSGSFYGYTSKTLAGGLRVRAVRTAF